MAFRRWFGNALRLLHFAETAILEMGRDQKLRYHLSKLSRYVYYYDHRGSPSPNCDTTTVATYSSPKTMCVLYAYYTQRCYLRIARAGIPLESVLNGTLVEKTVLRDSTIIEGQTSRSLLCKITSSRISGCLAREIFGHEYEREREHATLVPV